MASGLFANAKDYILKGNVDLTADTIRALLYNSTSTISSANPRSGSGNLGFSDSGVDDLADFSTLGEYLPGDSSSALTRQTVTLETSHDATNGRTLLKVTDGSGTGQAISFGSLAAATSPAAGVLFFHRSAKATTTFTFGDTEFDDTDNATITLTDYAGKAVTYTISNDFGADGAIPAQFNAGADIAACTANFKIAVEHASNHNGTIAVTDSGSGVIVLTQAKPGRAGNQPITTSNWDSICDVNVEAAFTGGGVGSGSDVAATDVPLMAVDLPSTVNGNGTEFKVQFTDEFAIISL